MNINPESIEFIFPSIICLFAFLPLTLNHFHQRDDDTKFGAYHLAIVYLICLMFAALAFLALRCIEVMQVDKSERLIFIFSILLVACFDQLVDLSPLQWFTKVNLILRLVYFIVLLSIIPVVWQISKSIIPLEMLTQSDLLNKINILLMVTVFIIGIANWSLKKNVQGKSNA